MLKRFRWRFDGGGANAGAHSHAAAEAALEAQQVAAAALLFEVARADFHVDPRERAAIRSTLARAYELGPERAAKVTAKAERAAEEAVSLYEFTRRLNDALSPDEKLEVIGMLWRVAFADGRIDKYEEHTVRKAADLLHVPHRRFIRARLAVERERRAGAGARATRRGASAPPG